MGKRYNWFDPQDDDIEIIRRALVGIGGITLVVAVLALLIWWAMG